MKSGRTIPTVSASRVKNTVMSWRMPQHVFPERQQRSVNLPKLLQHELQIHRSSALISSFPSVGDETL
jgi:hypothetical protein